VRTNFGATGHLDPTRAVRHDELHPGQIGQRSVWITFDRSAVVADRPAGLNATSSSV
jgi:hypothetical protein